jgi:hypothetical protein
LKRRFEQSAYGFYIPNGAYKGAIVGIRKGRGLVGTPAEKSISVNYRRAEVFDEPAAPIHRFVLAWWQW